MNICVFSASKDNIDPRFFAAAEELGSAMARRGHALIYGGGASGLMGAMARAAAAGGGRVVGVAPRFFDTEGVLYKEAAEFVFTDTMSERKTIMIDRADAFIAAPGGIGTLEELVEVITLKQLKQHDKPIALLNTLNHYGELVTLLENMAVKHFMAIEDLRLFNSCATPSEALDFLEAAVKG